MNASGIFMLVRPTGMPLPITQRVGLEDACSLEHGGSASLFPGWPASSSGPVKGLGFRVYGHEPRGHGLHRKQIARAAR